MTEQLTHHVAIVNGLHSLVRLSHGVFVKFGFGNFQKLPEKILGELRVPLYGQNSVGMTRQVIGAKLATAKMLKAFSRRNDLITMHCIERDRP